MNGWLLYQWCTKAFHRKEKVVDCFYFVHPDFVLLKSQPSVLKPGKTSATPVFGPIDTAMIQTIRVFKPDDNREPEVSLGTT